MKRTAEQVASLVHYDRLSQIPLLDPPKLEKEQITTFIACPNYEKAMRKVEQTMERYNGKVASIAADIKAQEEIIKKADWETTHFFGLDKTDPGKVAKHNHWVGVFNRAKEKRNDLIDKHSEAVEEAKEKLAELQSQALLVIDDDIVAVLDRCTKIVEKLANSHSSEDLLVAVEICLLELRVFHFFADHIEGNAARKECRERISEVNRLLAGLTESEHVRNALADLFRRNSYLVQKSEETYGELVKVLGSVNQGEVQRFTASLTKLFSASFETVFDYEGVVDPAELDRIISAIHSTIAALERNIQETQALGHTTGELAQSAVGAHRTAEALLAAMKSNVNKMQHELLSPGHFACELVDETVIDEFYPKDLRPAVAALRAHVAAAVDEEQLDRLGAADEDRYAIARAETAIERANLPRLEAERTRIAGHVDKLSRFITNARADIVKAGEVPQRNASSFRSSLALRHILSCLPAIGVLFGIGVTGKVKEFEAAFRSSNPIYKDLGAWALRRNALMTRAVLIAGGVIALAGLGVFFGASVSADAAVNAGVPAALLGLSLITGSLLNLAGKRLQSYGVAVEAVAAAEATASEQRSAGAG